jgi:hypothetical protein
MEYYVSLGGNDKNKGSINNPWRSIQKACRSMKAGDTVFIRGGTYNEKVEIEISGSADGGYVTIQNYEGERVIIDGLSKKEDCMIYMEDRSFIRIKGLEFCNNKSKNFRAGIYVEGSGSNIEIIDNKVYEISSSEDAHGIGIFGTYGEKSISNVLIDGNEVYNCILGSSEAVVVNGNVSNFRIINNHIHHNDNIGIDCIGYEGTAPNNDRARNGIVSNNHVHDISSAKNPAYEGEKCADGIYVDGGTNIIIERNNIYNCDIGIEVASEHKDKSSDNIIVRSNIISDCSLYGLCFGGAERENGIAEKNWFVNNTIVNNNVSIRIQQALNNVIKNNIVYGIDSLISGKIGTNIFSYNLWYSEKGNKQKLNPFQNPEFVNVKGNNYKLKVNSPAIDTGNVDNPSIYGELDFEGNSRIIGGKIDCGAYELRKN